MDLPIGDNEPTNESMIIDILLRIEKSIKLIHDKEENIYNSVPTKYKNLYRCSKCKFKGPIVTVQTNNNNDYQTTVKCICGNDFFVKHPYSEIEYIKLFIIPLNPLSKIYY